MSEQANSKHASSFFFFFFFSTLQSTDIRYLLFLSSWQEWLEALQAVIRQCQAEESSAHPSALIQYNGISARAKGNEDEVVDGDGEDEDVLLESEERPQLFDESGAATWQGPPTGQQEVTTSLEEEEEEESIEMASIWSIC